MIAIARSGPTAWCGSVSRARKPRLPGAVHLPAAVGRADHPALSADGELGLSNTLFSLVIAYTTFALPYALWLLRSFMAAIPRIWNRRPWSMARPGWALSDVILPQLLPGIISTALFTFILSWNEYLYALVLVNSDAARPLTTGVMTC